MTRSNIQSKIDEHQKMLQNRLQKNIPKFRAWAKKHNISCFRIFDRDIPEIPLSIDCYDDFLVVFIYAKKWKHEESDWKAYLDALFLVIENSFQIAPEHIFIKERKRQKGKQQYQRLQQDSFSYDTTEHNLQFEVNLSDYLDTGLFLDHRNLRKRVFQEADGKRFLNLFSYTGAFTVYAVAGGAKSSTTVDLSNTYIAWAKRNLKKNTSSFQGHRFIRDDVFNFLASSRRLDEFPYDLVVLDPPTFSNSKKMQDILDIQRDHVKLINQTLALMKKGGVLYFSNNFRGFKLSEKEIQSSSITEISKETVPHDFHNKQIHRSWRIVKP